MTHLLPPNLLRNFAPRAPIPYIKPAGPDWYNELGDRKLEGLAGILDEIRAEAALKEAEAEDEAAKKANSTKTAKDAKSSTTGAAKAEPDGEESAEKPAGDAKMEEPEETGEIIEESKEQVGELAIKKAEEQGLSYTEAEKYRLRQLEKKRKREENFKAALAECKFKKKKNLCCPLMLTFARVHWRFRQTNRPKTQKLWEIHTRRCSSLVYTTMQQRKICEGSLACTVRLSA